MSPEPAVSVVISSRNRAHCLADTLATLAAQAGDIPFEVVVIDNGSTDQTPAVLAEWGRRDNRFRAGREPHPGLSRGKNAGIRMARGRVLLFTDDDMQIHPRWIESYHTLFTHHPEAHLAGGPIVPIPQDLGRWPGWLDESALADAGLLNHWAERELGRFEYVWGGNMAVDRRLFEQCGLWDETVGLQGEQRVTRPDSQFFEDTEFQDRVRRAGVSVWFCPGAIVYHRVDRRQITPRRVAATAFARGRNALWVRELAIWQDLSRVPRRNAARCSANLAANLFRWGAGAALFRYSGRRDAFEAVRRAAFSAGLWLDSLRAGRPSGRMFRAAARVTFAARGLFLRLIPDGPGR